MLDCEFIATGHYGMINEREGRRYITRARDRQKDQSYVLWGLSQECLQRTRMPLGVFTKPEVRQMAAERGWDELSKKAESYEICFVPDNDYRGFLRRVDGLDEQVAGGHFVDAGGRVLGRHEGYPFYTVSASARAWVSPWASPCSSRKYAPTPTPSYWAAKTT
jgi:tRNA-specific 2-thiouridylase